MESTMMMIAAADFPIWPMRTTPSRIRYCTILYGCTYVHGRGERFVERMMRDQQQNSHGALTVL